VLAIPYKTTQATTIYIDNITPVNVDHFQYRGSFLSSKAKLAVEHLPDYLPDWGN
jgi:hypothetical protein